MSMDMNKAMWDRKARTFPLFQRNAKDTCEILDFFHSNGIDFACNILEIGCGNGRFSLELAFMAQHLFALDISSEMLRCLRHCAQDLGHQNITLFESSWENFSPSIALPIEVEMAFMAMTPAIHSKPMLHKALQSCLAYWCYIGWGRVRECEFLEEILNIHNVTLRLPVGLPDVLCWLDELGYHPKFLYKEYHYTYKGSLQQTFESIQWHIHINGGTPNTELIEKYINKYAKNNQISYAHKREIGIASLLK